MKFANISYNNKDLVALEFDDTKLVSLDRLLAETEPKYDTFIFEDILSVINAGQDLLDEIENALAVLKQKPDIKDLIPLMDVSWYPPVQKPGKICGVAMNNSASNERKISAPEHPAFFLKPASCLVGHEQAIKIRPYYGSVHPEPELSIIIGKQARDVSAANALDVVFGYSIFNDITSNGMRAEDLFQYRAIYAKKDNPNETEWVEQHLSYAGRYKGCDTFGCLGPWLVTKDDIPNPDDLKVLCKIGEDVIAEDNTRYYNYKIAEIISFISQFHTLNPGDIISCGTAFKPSANRKSIHHANFQLVEGPVEVSIEGLGTQINSIILEQKEIGQWRLN
jgi:2-keto-4-pentenoate hydratase/2-oxohepta-3-ene-1,7-dioic acid hydratase in catechol pathway